MPAFLTFCKRLASFVRVGSSGLLLAIVLGLLIFGPRDFGHAKSPKGFTEVTYWEKWTGNEAAQMQLIVDDFNKTVGREKNIFVKFLTISNIEERTLAATAAGVPPDVAGLTDEQIAQFAALDALEPLENLDLAGHGIRRELFKPVCWDGCVFEGHLWALPSTPTPVALHHNKRILQENAAALRAGGFDPDHIPDNLAEFDRFAQVLDRREANGKIVRAGYLAIEPGWFINFTPYWFGASYFDDATGKFSLTDPGVVRTFEWIRDYSVHYTPDAITQFQSGGSGVNSTQNPFLTGAVATEQQGCWTANFIEDLAPALNRWQRFLHEEPAMIAAGMKERDERWHKFEDEIGAVLRPLVAAARRAALDQKIDAESKLSIDARRANYEWGAAAFPSAIAGLKNATYTGFDALTIPRGAKHKAEAFEFIAYVNRQDVTEKLNMLQCKMSPLRAVSKHYLSHHPNPYIAVFEELAASPNSHGVPRCPIWPEVVAEMNDTTQKIVLLEEEPAKALAEAQERLQARLDQFNARQAQRRNSDAQNGRSPMVAKLATLRQHELRQAGKGLAFLAPWLFGYIVLTLIPVAMSAYFSLTDYSLLQKPAFVGLENYHELMFAEHPGMPGRGDLHFWTVVRNTLYYACIALPCGIVISLGLAMVLNLKVPGQALYRTIIFLPSLVPEVAAAFIWLWMFNAKLGLVNVTLTNHWPLVGQLLASGPGWLTDPNWAMPAMILMSFWGVGNTVVIFLAGLQDVPRELYEAAEIDGSGIWGRMRHVTLPTLSPVILFNLIMGLIASLQFFSIPQLMTQGNPAESTRFYTMYLRDNAFVFLKMGYASAMAWMQLLVILLLTAIAFWSSRKWVHYQGK